MTTEEAIKILTSALETAGAYVCSIELYGDADDAEDFLKAIRVLLEEYRTLEDIVEHDRGCR